MMKLLAIFLVAISLSYGYGYGYDNQPGQEEIGINKPPWLQPCEMECQKKGGECSWKSPGKGYKNTGYCKSGKWGTGTNCYCGYCWVNDQLPCNGQINCWGLNGEPGVCSQTPIAGLIKSGKCPPGDGKSCDCWVKPVVQDCEQKECRGQEGQPGKCSATMPGSGMVVSGACESSGVKKCPCWVLEDQRPCGDEIYCVGENGREGKCFKERPSKGWRRSGRCERSGCTCYVRCKGKRCDMEIA